jgi:hypothetical protein
MPFGTYKLYLKAAYQLIYIKTKIELFNADAFEDIYR